MPIGTGSVESAGRNTASTRVDPPVCDDSNCAITISVGRSGLNCFGGRIRRTDDRSSSSLEGPPLAYLIRADAYSTRRLGPYSLNEGAFHARLPAIASATPDCQSFPFTSTLQRRPRRVKN